MRLSELMSGMNLATFPQVALVIFIGVFVAVSARMLWRGRRDGFDAERALPLDDGSIGSREDTP